MPSGEQLLAPGKVQLLNVLQLGEQSPRNVGISIEAVQIGYNLPLPTNALLAFVNENFRTCQFVFKIRRHNGLPCVRTVAPKDPNGRGTLRFKV